MAKETTNIDAGKLRYLLDSVLSTAEAMSEGRVPGHYGYLRICDDIAEAQQIVNSPSLALIAASAPDVPETAPMAKPEAEKAKKGE